MPVLSCRGLSCRAGGRDVVSGVDLDIEPGERVALMGPSGSGKTTLLTALAGLTPPSAGTITTNGTSAVVFQSYGLLTLLTAAENVEVALRARGSAPADAIERAGHALERLQVAKYAHHLIEELSGGQQQRVAVARAIALRPEVLLADEPTAEQDKANRALVLDALLTSDAALVMATHDPEVAARCDRIIEVRR